MDWLHNDDNIDEATDYQIMMIFASLASWVGISTVTLFLFSNIKSTDIGVGYIYLVVAGACLAFLIATKRNAAEAVLIPPSTFFLLAFIAYFLLRLLLDTSDSSEIKAFTIGTSGGVIVALLLGTAVSMMASTAFDLKQDAILRSLLSLLFALMCLFLAVDTFTTHLSVVREDLFLVQADNPKYQRAGNFSVMVVVIMSMQLVRVAFKTRRSLIDNTLVAANLVLYVLVVGVLLATSQLIGSNTGFVVILFLSIGTLAFLWRPNLTRQNCASVLLRRRIDTVSLLRKSAPRLFLNSVVVCVFAIAIGVVAMSFLGLDPHQFRIFGFGDERIGGNSLVSRLEMLWNNFVIQFAYSPVFGNLRADALTTGQGTYAHSLLSLLSHLGFIGTSLFVAYLVAVFRELRISKSTVSQLYAEIDVGLFRATAVSIVFCFALLATFFTWMPLWFSLAFLFPPFVFRSSWKPYSEKLLQYYHA